MYAQPTGEDSGEEGEEIETYASMDMSSPPPLVRPSSAATPAATTTVVTATEGAVVYQATPPTDKDGYQSMGHGNGKEPMDVYAVPNKRDDEPADVYAVAAKPPAIPAKAAAAFSPPAAEAEADDVYDNDGAEDPELAIHADLGRDQAEQVLKDYGLSDGVFLLRKKSDTKTVLTLCTHAAKASIKHHVLEVTAGGVTINKAALSQHCDTLQDAIALFRTGAPGEKHPDVRVKATVMVAPGAAPAPAKKAPYGPLDPKLAYAHKGRVDREKDIFGEDIRARDTAAATAGLEL